MKRRRRLHQRLLHLEQTVAVLTLLALFPPALALAAQETISLAGHWRFALDRADAGVRQHWFDRRLAARVRLPGSLPAEGIGDPISLATPWMGDIQDTNWFNNPVYAPYSRPGNSKFPFWLQPNKYYTGVAWYQRDIRIPRAWQDERMVLTLERPHWKTRVWLDHWPVGANDSLSTAHLYDLGQIAAGTHTLTIRVDNRLIADIGVNSHSITDQTQGNWNGIVGRIDLRATPLVWVDDIQVFPNVDSRSARVRMTLHNLTGRPARGGVSLSVEPYPHTPPLRMPACNTDFNTAENAIPLRFDVSLGLGARLWDEFSPALYRLRTEVRGQADGRAFAYKRFTTFGLREIATRGTQFTVNGRKTFFRGTLECCIFPKTGHPPTTVGPWKRILRICKAHGLNLIRFHSWCPPEAAFVAADQLGFYYQVECASWANQSTTLGDGKPVDAWLYREAARILRAYGNHPCFVLMPYGNEPGGRHAAAYLARWVTHWKAADPRRLYTSASGWPDISENQFDVTPAPRIQQWGAGLTSRINAKPPETRSDYREIIQAHHVPLISHEMGEWCVYPDFAEMKKYTGYLKPKNFEIFHASLRAHQLGDLAQRFLLASGKLQTLCYKQDIESALRTPGMGGFELLDLHDFPGQGTALVGVLDPFWDDKGYVTAAQYRRFCNSTVPLARLSKRVFTTDETLVADLEAAHFGPAPLTNIVTVWKLVRADGKIAATGRLPTKTIPIDNGIPLGWVAINLKNVAAPARYQLVVGLAGTPFENDWSVWVYPPHLNLAPPPDVTVVDDLDDNAVAKLEAGAKVLWLPPPARVRGDRLGKVALGFSPIFWNTAWTRRQPPHTLGILCDPAHPLFRRFPTECHSNWQWWYLVSRAGAMILDGLPPKLRPLVEVIDDWVTNRRLGLVFEARIGQGRLMVCSIDLQHDLQANPVARQMRYSLLRYMETRRFQPRVRLPPGDLRRLVKPPG